jgi:hypothetical protein
VSITYSISACSSRPAEIGNLSECTDATLSVLSIRREGGDDLECVTVIGAGGAKGEGEMDAVADVTVRGAGIFCCCCRDMAVEDGDLDFLRSQNQHKRKKGHHQNRREEGMHNGLRSKANTCLKRSCSRVLL